MTSECLKNYEANEFVKILNESQNFDEILTATYSRAMQFDCFENYHPQRLPFPERGWNEDYAEYKTLSVEKRSQGWKYLSEKYQGYLKAKDEIKAQNASNKYFLEDMKKHFERIGILSFVRQIEDRLREWL